MSISQGRVTTPAPVSSRYRKPTVEDFRPQPEGGEAFAVNTHFAASPPGGTGRVFMHGIAIGRLVGVKHTAASAVSPCTKIATVAHAGILQRLPSEMLAW
jgi:hypothetical protein